MCCCRFTSREAKHGIATPFLLLSIVQLCHHQLQITHTGGWRVNQLLMGENPRGRQRNLFEHLFNRGLIRALVLGRSVTARWLRCCPKSFLSSSPSGKTLGKRLCRFGTKARHKHSSALQGEHGHPAPTATCGSARTKRRAPAAIENEEWGSSTHRYVVALSIFME